MKLKTCLKFLTTVYEKGFYSFKQNIYITLWFDSQYSTHVPLTYLIDLCSENVIRERNVSSTSIPNLIVTKNYSVSHDLCSFLECVHWEHKHLEKQPSWAHTEPTPFPCSAKAVGGTLSLNSRKKPEHTWPLWSKSSKEQELRTSPVN